MQDRHVGRVQAPSGGGFDPKSVFKQFDAVDKASNGAKVTVFVCENPGWFHMVSLGSILNSKLETFKKARKNK